MKTSALSTSQTNVSELTDRTIVKLWQKMVHMYGHRWASAYGEVMENGKLTAGALLWKSGLKGLSGRQIANGLSRCIETGEDWPPSLPRFRAMCLGEDEQKVENSAMYQRPECLALPRPRPSKDKARPYLQALRQAVSARVED